MKQHLKNAQFKQTTEKHVAELGPTTDTFYRSIWKPVN